MSFVIQAELKNNWNKLDRYVFTNKVLSDGAKVLYGYLIGLKDGDNFSDTYILKALGISRAVLGKRKRELKKENLIYTYRVNPRTFMIFIGNTHVTAVACKDSWLARQDNIK